MAATSVDSIPLDIVEQLKTYWLPQLRAIADRRKTTVRIMVAAICVPLVFVAGLAGVLLYNYAKFGVIELEMAGIGALLLGVPALAFVHLGKLQRCNDTLVAVELFVHLRDRVGLVQSLSSIECLGGLEAILNDAERLISAAR